MVTKFSIPDLLRSKMAPNVLGNTLLLAEACIEQEDPNNNSQIKANKSILNVRTATAESAARVQVRATILISRELSLRWQPLLKRHVSFSPSQADEPQKTEQKQSASSFSSSSAYRTVLVWRNIIAFVYLHAGFLYGVYLSFTSAKGSTTLLGKCQSALPETVLPILRLRCQLRGSASQ